METARLMLSLLNTLKAVVRIGELIAFALANKAPVIDEHPDIVQRTETFERSDPEEVGVLRDRFRQERFRVPTIRDDDTVRCKLGDSVAESVPDRLGIPFIGTEQQWNALDGKGLCDKSHFPILLDGVEVANLIPGLLQKLRRLECMNRATSR